MDEAEAFRDKGGARGREKGDEELTCCTLPSSHSALLLLLSFFYLSIVLFICLPVESIYLDVDRVASSIQPATAPSASHQAQSTVESPAGPSAQEIATLVPIWGRGVGGEWSLEEPAKQTAMWDWLEAGRKEKVEEKKQRRRRKKEEANDIKAEVESENKIEVEAEVGQLEPQAAVVA